MRQWKCIQVNHHDEVAVKITEFEEKGWELDTYNVCSIAGTGTVKHYLLFLKEE